MIVSRLFVSASGNNCVRIGFVQTKENRIFPDQRYLPDQSAEYAIALILRHTANAALIKLQKAAFLLILTMLCQVEAVTAAKARLLHNAGLTSIEMVASSDEERVVSALAAGVRSRKPVS